ncbi:MAG: ABC transporter ATP-binding protein [Candidatus Dormibacter sp.]|uniref:ABC transporter ATP-binding protein n=1 Tax=Candidatus Dormibacter sp. TaxID=2973982 RepID=UPI000DB71695|nr:MAG: ABC transporter ATP-binding protein [Candidatus Dormibacteraeota bacterium]
MHTSDLVVETAALTKRYRGGKLAVDSLDLKVRRGEIYGLVGPNGAGKTTTLRMLVGLIRPTSGSALVAGHRPGAPAGLRKIGAVIENPAFYTYLSGRDNLRVVAHYGDIAERAVETALEEVDLLPAAKGRYGSYSLGMKQRLGVAAALIKEPELLILDEPTNGLDPQGMVEMRGLIKSLGTAGHTVLVCSHLLSEMQLICHRFGVIQNGRLIAEDDLADARQAGLLIRGNPAGRVRVALERVAGAKAIAVRDGAFMVNADHVQAAEIHRALVRAGVEITELRPAERSLEEVFLEITEGRQ